MLIASRRVGEEFNICAPDKETVICSLKVKNIESRHDVHPELTGKCGYKGVGVVEFLADKKRDFCFIEMNAAFKGVHRTEETMGIGLVKRVANDEKLTLRRKDIV